MPRSDNKIAIWLTRDTTYERLKKMKRGKDYYRSKIGMKNENFDDVIRRLLADHEELKARIHREANLRADSMEIHGKIASGS